MWFLATAGVSCSGAKDNFSEKSDVMIKCSIAVPQGLFLVGAFDAQASSPIQPIWDRNDVSDLICVDSEAIWSRIRFYFMKTGQYSLRVKQAISKEASTTLRIKTMPIMIWSLSNFIPDTINSWFLALIQASSDSSVQFNLNSTCPLTCILWSKCMGEPCRSYSGPF